MSRNRIPKRGDRVHVKKHTGEFLVLRVNEKARVADLGLSGGDWVEERVPFTAIRMVPEHENQTAAPEQLLETEQQ